MEQAGNGTEGSIQSECAQAHAMDGVALAGGHVLAHGDISLSADMTLSPPPVSEDDDQPLEKDAPVAIRSPLSSFPTTFALPPPVGSPPPPAPPPSNSPQLDDRSVPKRDTETNSSPTTSPNEHQHQASTTSLRPLLPVPACDLGLPTDVTPPSPPASSHSSPEREPVGQPVSVHSAESSPKSGANSSESNKGRRGRSFSSLARRFLPKRNSGFFKWPSSKGKDLHSTPSPVPPLPPCATTTITTGAEASELVLKANDVAPVLPPIRIPRALTAPSDLSTPNSSSIPPLPSSPSLATDRMTAAAKASQNREAKEANTEEGKKQPPAPDSPLPRLPTSPNVPFGSLGVKPGKKGKWHFAADSDDDDSETSSLKSDSERESEDEPRGRALSRVRGVQARATTAVSAPPTNVTGSTPIRVALPLRSKSTSLSPALIAVAAAPKVKETSIEPLDQNASREGNCEKPQPPTLKLEVPSLSDVNLATVIFSEADSTNELTEVNVAASGSPAGTMVALSPVSTDSPFSARTRVASSEEGQTESKGREDGSDDESEDPFNADAQLLTPGSTPTSPTNGTLSTTFVFPPPGVPRSPALAVPLPPSPVSPTSSHHRSSSPPQLSLSPVSKRKSILGAIRLVGAVKRGVGSNKKNAAANNVGSPTPKSSPARSKTTPITSEGAKQSKSRPHPISTRRAPDPRRSSTMPRPRSAAHGGGAGDGRYLLIPLSPGTRTEVQIVRKERQPLCPTMHTGGTIQAETWEIMDEESRRLSEVAFM